MTKIRLVIFLIVFLAGTGHGISAAAGGGSSPQGVALGEARPLADQLVGQLFSGYQNYSRPAFEQLISDDFRPMRAKFFARLESRVYGGKVLEMHYVLNEVLVSRDRLIVGFSWEKKTVPVGGAEAVLSRGKSRVVFVHSGENWQLRSISGNNPF